MRTIEFRDDEGNFIKLLVSNFYSRAGCAFEGTHEITLVFDIEFGSSEGRYTAPCEFLHRDGGLYHYYTSCSIWIDGFAFAKEFRWISLDFNKDAIRIVGWGVL